MTEDSIIDIGLFDAPLLYHAEGVCAGGLSH